MIPSLGRRTGLPGATCHWALEPAPAGRRPLPALFARPRNQVGDLHAGLEVLEGKTVEGVVGMQVPLAPSTP